LATVVLAALTSPLACDDSSTEQPPGSTGVPCEADAECDDGISCTHEFCIDKFCTNPPISGDDPAMMQIPGDCQRFACRDGMSVTEPDDGDDPDDNDGDCFETICSGGMLDQVPRMVGEPCSNGACDGMGMCSCAVPGMMLDIDQFVDPVMGTDDVMHGAGPGSCAYRTLDYALTRATERIHLAHVTYTAMNGTTYPIVLTANQRLLCDYDGNNQTTATISGSGTFGMGTATVVYDGVRNGVSECIVEGAGADACILIDTDAMQDLHYVRYSDISGCGRGIHVTANGNDVELDGSSIHDNTVAGIVFDTGDKNGFLQNHNFDSNGTPAMDITCASPSPELQSFGNNNGANGAPICQGCAACPFQ
jgi:hypothetical protein